MATASLCEMGVGGGGAVEIRCRWVGGTGRGSHADTQDGPTATPGFCVCQDGAGTVRKRRATVTVTDLHAVQRGLRIRVWGIGGQRDGGLGAAGLGF